MAQIRTGYKRSQHDPHQSNQEGSGADAESHRHASAPFPTSPSKGLFVFVKGAVQHCSGDFRSMCRTFRKTFPGFYPVYLVLCTRHKIF